MSKPPPTNIVHRARTASPIVVECDGMLPASPTEVWQVLVDFKTWPEWQKAYRVNGDALVGSDIDHAVWTQSRSGRKTPIELKGSVTVVDRPHRLAWTLGVPKILFITVDFELEGAGGKTRLKHRMQCEGFFSGIAKGRFRKTVTPFMQAFCISLERRLRKPPKQKRWRR